MLEQDLHRDWRHHWSLKPNIHYLNHGAFGACPRAVQHAHRELLSELDRQPMSFLARELPGRLDEARRALASFLVAKPDDLAFVPNASTGINAVLRSLEFSTGDQILTTNHCYNACMNALKFVAERSGAQIVVVDIDLPIESPEAVVEQVVAAAGERCKLALLDHVSSSTAIVFPIKEIVRRLQEKGIDALVDGAHAPGMLPLKLDELGAAYYTGNCHKWLCAPRGAAFLHVRDDRKEGLRPTVISHGANMSLPGRSRFHMEFDWVGTQDYTAYLSVPAAIKAVGSFMPGGWEAVQTRNRNLALVARQVLAEIMGVEQLPCPDTMVGSIAALPLPPASWPPLSSVYISDPLQQELLDLHKIEVPVFYWPEHPRRYMRISAQLYNNLHDYQALAQALA